MSAKGRLTIRKARRGDAETLVRLIDELNAIEKEPATALTPADIRRDGFGPDRWFTAFVAESEGRPAGYAILARSYHPQRGGPGFHLVDLYLEAGLRGRGLGRALMAAVAKHCRAKGGHWLAWHVWVENAAAFAFYEALGAKHVSEASVMLLDGEDFDALAADQGA